MKPKNLFFKFLRWYPPTCLIYLWGPRIVQRKPVLFLFVLKINLLLNFLKYLLWVEGNNFFFLLSFALGRKYFCALSSPKEKVASVCLIQTQFTALLQVVLSCSGSKYFPQGHFPQRSVSSPVTLGSKGKLVNTCCPSHPTSSGLHPNKLSVSFFFLILSVVLP